AQKIDPPSALHLPGGVVSEPAGGHVLKREADAAKDCDLFGRLPAWLEPGNDFSQLRMDRSAGQAGTSHGSHFDRKLSVIHHHACRGECVGSNFTLSGLIRTERRNVQTRVKMPPKQEWLTRPGGSDGDICACQHVI